MICHICLTVSVNISQQCSGVKQPKCHCIQNVLLSTVVTHHWLCLLILNTPIDMILSSQKQGGLNITPSYVQHGYEMIKQSNNRIEYLHLPKQYFLFNFITKSKYFPKVFADMSILRIQYDGNVIKIEGMFYHIQRLLWKLKKHYI